LGARVALVDREKFGGECLYTGCVPSKALLQVARLAAQVRSAEQLGLSAQLAPVDLGAVADHIQRVIDEIYVNTDAPENYAAFGIEPLLGEVRFVSPTAVTINGQQVTAKRYLICTGSHPRVASMPGLAEASYLTNETVFAQRRLPRSLVVIGGGPVGCELGQAFARFGSQVTILQRPDRILPKDEPEAAAVLAKRLLAEGVTILTRADAQAVVMRDGLKTVEAATPNGPVQVAGEEILVAVGRSPTVEGFGLDAARVAYDWRTGIATDAYLRTSNRRVFAAGDVRGGYLFTHAAALQARTAVRNMLLPGIARSKLDERAMPWATFTEPEIAHTGLTEAEARRQYGAGVRAYVQPLRGVDRAVTEGETEGFIKLVCTEKGKLLGATLAGPAASEYINELALALSQGLSLSRLAGTTHVYPTVALGIQQAAGRYSLAATSKSGLVRFLRRFAG